MAMVGTETRPRGLAYLTAPRGFGATVKLRYLYGGLRWRSVYGVDPLSTIHVQTEILHRGFISTVFPPVFPPYQYFHRISTVDSTTDTSLPLIHADPPLYHCYYTRKLCCAHNPFILNWISLSSIHITLLFLHRSLLLTGISNLPSSYLFRFHPCFSMSSTFAEKVQPIVRVADMAWGWWTKVLSQYRKGGEGSLSKH